MVTPASQKPHAGLRAERAESSKPVARSGSHALPIVRASIHSSTASSTNTLLRVVIRTGGGKAPDWTMRLRVDLDTPIISRTSRGLMNLTLHLPPI